MAVGAAVLRLHALRAERKALMAIRPFVPGAEAFGLTIRMSALEVVRMGIIKKNLKDTINVRENRYFCKHYMFLL